MWLGAHEESCIAYLAIHNRNSHAISLVEKPGSKYHNTTKLQKHFTTCLNCLIYKWFGPCISFIVTNQDKEAICSLTLNIIPCAVLRMFSSNMYSLFSYRYNAGYNCFLCPPTLLIFDISTASAVLTCWHALQSLPEWSLSFRNIYFSIPVSVHVSSFRLIFGHWRRVIYSFLSLYPFPEHHVSLCFTFQIRSLRWLW